jgi:hypothetical protein
MTSSRLQVAGAVAALLFSRSAVAQRGSSRAGQPPATLSGIVIDSIAGTPVAAARIAVAGTPLAAVSDAAGRFSIAGVAPGDQLLEIHTASLDSVKAMHRATVSVNPASPVRVRVPSASQIIASLCGTPLTDHAGILFGAVEIAGESVPPRDARVVAEWGTEGSAAAMKGSAVARTNAQGTFRLCGVPVDMPVYLQAEVPGTVTAPFPVRVPANGRIVRADLSLDREAPKFAVFTGVVTDSAQQPVAGAQVALPGLAKAATTDARGAFRISDLPSGEHAVEVRHVGYSPADLRVTVSGSETVERTIRLTRVVALDSVIVNAAPRAVLPDFEENRKLGLGHFFTRADLAKQEGRRMSDVLGQLGGVKVVTRGPHAWMVNNRGVRSLQPRGRCPGLENGPDGGAVNCPCYPLVYLDDAVLYRGAGPTDIVPDVNRFDVASIEAIEFYASAAQTPLKYSVLNSPCGVLVFHTRRTP